MLPPPLEAALLARLDARLIAYRSGGVRYVIASDGSGADVAMRQDLRVAGPLASIAMAFETLASRGGRQVHIVDAVEGGELELVIGEARLRADMWRFARNILILSLIISALTATAVFLALRRMLVHPMERLTEAMVAFRRAPEGDVAIILPSNRTDELGLAERELAEMQTTLRDTLNERARLAALGLAVAKINHDLRNMLASAQLFIERLEMVPDPAVQRLAPKLVGALDRAITFTQDTLRYGRAQERAPRRERVNLRALLDAVAESSGLRDGEAGIAWRNTVPSDLDLAADPDHLFRIATNLVRNAQAALSDAARADAAQSDAAPPRGRGRITASGGREGEASARAVWFEIADDGPGVPHAARAKLFKPFGTVGHAGGTGLGLSIADELARAHGGTIRLRDVGGSGKGGSGEGAVFRVTIPDVTC